MERKESRLLADYGDKQHHRNSHSVGAVLESARTGTAILQPPRLASRDRLSSRVEYNATLKGTMQFICKRSR